MMTKLHFNLDLGNQKYIMNFLSDNQVKIIQPDNKNKVIIVQYFADTTVCNFMKCIKFWDFSKLKDNEQKRGV